MNLFLPDAEMAFGEQAALVGVVAALQPGLSLELGTFRGGTLRHIAAHSCEVHTFDLVSHTTEALANVSYHLGDTRESLPRVLHELSVRGRTVDFVLVDADHSRAGVQRDMSNLLQSAALASTVILVHDCANEAVRKGVRNAIVDDGDIAYADLNFLVPGLALSPLGESWGGLGIVVVDRERRLWTLERQICANVEWPSAHQRSGIWNALGPVRAGKRELAYRARPLYRRIIGSRGIRLG